MNGAERRPPLTESTRAPDLGEWPEWPPRASPVSRQLDLRRAHAWVSRWRLARALRAYVYRCRSESPLLWAPPPPPLRPWTRRWLPPGLRRVVVRLAQCQTRWRPRPRRLPDERLTHLWCPTGHVTPPRAAGPPDRRTT